MRSATSVTTKGKYVKADPFYGKKVSVQGRTPDLGHRASSLAPLVQRKARERRRRRGRKCGRGRGKEVTAERRLEVLAAR